MKTYTLLILSLLIFSCNNSSEEKTVETKTENHADHKSETLHLNNTNKWKVVPDMMAYIVYMKEDIAKFEGKNLEDFQNLATDLLINVDLLTANCTMKGEAHDQLHVWLVPYIELINKFANETELVEKKNLFKDLEKSFDVLGDFFE